MNILQKFASETPAEAKKAQVIFLALAAIVVKIATYHIVPVNITNDAFAALGAMAAFAQFASKDAGIIEEAIAHPLTLITDIPTVISQISEIHAAIKAPLAADVPVAQVIADVEQAVAPVFVVSQPATIISNPATAPQPVVNVPV